MADVQSIEFSETLATVHRWLHDYTGRPHPHLGRSGAVCPFVMPSLRADSLESRVRLVGPAPTAGLLIEMLRCAMDEFDLIPWRGSNPALRALLVLLPDLPEDRLHLLDEIHPEVKQEAVRRGMMLGQFHPRCSEPAGRNPAFPVNRSPVPLVAFRHMALHDVLFLLDRPDWFAAYFERFGSRYRTGKDGLDPLFVELFEQGCSKYGMGI